PESRHDPAEQRRDQGIPPRRRPRRRRVAVAVHPCSIRAAASPGIVIRGNLRPERACGRASRALRGVPRRRARRPVSFPAVIHETTIRVRYGEVDRMGVVYHAHYLPYFEAGRTEFFRSLGHAYRDVEESGMLLVVADAGLR